jgi:hypothetical protein
MILSSKDSVIPRFHKKIRSGQKIQLFQRPRCRTAILNLLRGAPPLPPPRPRFCRRRPRERFQLQQYNLLKGSHLENKWREKLSPSTPLVGGKLFVIRSASFPCLQTTLPTPDTLPSFHHSIIRNPSVMAALIHEFLPLLPFWRRGLGRGGRSLGPISAVTDRLPSFHHST